MKNRFLVRRIFLLLVLAILLWTVLTAVVTALSPILCLPALKRENSSRAEIIIACRNKRFNNRRYFCVYSVDHSDELFGNWIYIVNRKENRLPYATSQYQGS